MSHEVELERPARVEQRERVVLQKPKQQPPSQGPGDVDGGVVLEKEEQCVCQICTCGKHRCRSASSDFSANHIQDALQQRACAGCEKEAGRRQWEVSPDTVRQISKSYRSIERQDDASETTTVSEQRLSRQERASDSKVFHAQAVANGTAILGDEIGGQNRQRAAHAVESGKAALSGDAMASHVVQTSEFAAHESEEHMKSEANCHRHSASWQADGGRAEGRVSSRYRPKTSLRLDGPHEYTTTSSEYFSTVDHNLVSRAEQYRSERQATSESRHYPLTRPQTSLRTGGKTHYSTTTAEDFKLHDQAEKVTRRLRPRRFDDPSYDTAHVDDEGDVKKRRTEADHAVEDHVTAADDFQDRTEGIVAQGDSYGGQLRSGELVSSEAQTYEQSYLEANHQHRETSRVGEAREEFEMLQSQVMESSHLTDHPLGAMASDAYFQPEVSAPFYPKDNLALSTGEMDLRTTNEMEYYKKKMDRVRPVKPKSLAKLFGSNGSSSDGDLYAVPSHRNEKPSRLQKGRVEQTHAAGLASTCDDLKMHLGANNVLIKHKAKGQRKAHFEDDSFKWDGPVSYSTTTNESYKKPESSRGRVALCRRPQSHDVFHRFTQTGDELRKIKGKKQDTDEITMFGRKDSAELIAEIQGLLGAKDSGRSENKAAKQNASVRKKAALEKTSKRERSQQAIEAGNWQGFQQEAQERPRGQQKGKAVRKDATHKARFAGQVLNGERVTFQEKRNAEIPVEQHESRMRDVVEIDTGQQEYLESSVTARKYEAMHQKRVQAKDDVHRSEEVIVEGNEAQGYFDQGAVSSEAHRLVKQSAERPLVSRVENSHLSGADQNKFHFSTTTADSFKNVGEKIQPPKPFYPKPNLAPEGSMSFETVHHGEFTPKTVVEVPTPVRPVSTLKLSDDTSYLVRNEDKIGYSKAPPVIGETRFSVRKPESTLVLGHDSVEYKTTSQTEYKAHELREMEDIYKKSVKVKRDRQKTYTRGQPAGAASAVPGVLQQRQRSSSGIGNMTTTTRAAYKPVSVERPQPYRPQSCLKVRSNEDSYAEISTTMRDTFRRVTPTARVKPIKREASLKKLGDDTDYVPRKTTTGEAYREVKIPPKPEPYRPVDNLKVTGRMTFSTTTQESYVSRSSLQHHASEFVERAKPIKRDAVAKDIIFPVDSSDALAQGATDYAFTRGAEESTEVLRSLENTGAYARISKAPRERPRTHQKVGRGTFEHTTTSMAEYQDPRTRSWKQRSTATGRLVRTASAECPAAFLNTDKSEYVFKEVIGDHRFYLPAVQ